MLVTRHYNRMPEGDMLEILESQNLADDHCRLALVVDDLPLDFFLAGVKSGWLQANDIVVNGVVTSTYTASVAPALAHAVLWCGSDCIIAGR